jgi:hypothetical protein
MDRDSSGVSTLLGLDGFVVSAQLLEETTGEWWLAVTLHPQLGVPPAQAGRAAPAIP